MKYKMLVLDVDGTLLNDEKEISKRTLNTLLKVQQMGVRIMLASGRPLTVCCHWPRNWNWVHITGISSLITVAR